MYCALCINVLYDMKQNLLLASTFSMIFGLPAVTEAGTITGRATFDAGPGISRSFDLQQGGVTSTELRNSALTATYSAAVDIVDKRAYKIFNQMTIEALPLDEQPIFWNSTDAFSSVFAESVDTITVSSNTSGITPGISGGTIIYFFDVSGTIENSLNLLPDRGVNAYEVTELFSRMDFSLTRSGFGLPNRLEVLFDARTSLPNSLFFPNEAYIPALKSFDGQIVQASLPFIYGEEGEVTFKANAVNSFQALNIDGADSFLADFNVDFGNTLVLREAIVLDENGNLDTGAVINSALGIDYLTPYSEGTASPPTEPVPEPLTLLGSGVALAIGYATRRFCGRSSHSSDTQHRSPSS